MLDLFYAIIPRLAKIVRLLPALNDLLRLILEWEKSLILLVLEALTAITVYSRTNNSTRVWMNKLRLNKYGEQYQMK